MEKLSIAELEKMLQQDDEIPLEILPNGEIRMKDPAHAESSAPLKPLTMRDNLGGEYGGVPSAPRLDVANRLRHSVNIIVKKAEGRIALMAKKRPVFIVGMVVVNVERLRATVKSSWRAMADSAQAILLHQHLLKDLDRYPTRPHQVGVLSGALKRGIVAFLDSRYIQGPIRNLNAILLIAQDRSAAWIFWAARLMFDHLASREGIAAGWTRAQCPSSRADDRLTSVRLSLSGSAPPTVHRLSAAIGAGVCFSSGSARSIMKLGDSARLLAYRAELYPYLGFPPGAVSVPVPLDVPVDYLSVAPLAGDDGERTPVRRHMRSLVAASLTALRTTPARLRSHLSESFSILSRSSRERRIKICRSVGCFIRFDSTTISLAIQAKFVCARLAA